MTGREPQKENDLFFTCSLIDYIEIEDFNSSFYYDAPQNILNAFLDGKIEFSHSHLLLRKIHQNNPENSTR